VTLIDTNVLLDLVTNPNRQPDLAHAVRRDDRQVQADERK
jgi:hypothetical protein